MSDTAVHLEQCVLPEVPIRHWPYHGPPPAVCTFPWGVRAVLGYCPTVSSSGSQPSSAVSIAPSRVNDVRVGADRSVHDRARFARLSRIDCATLCQRVFDVDPLQCSSCGGGMRFVEVIEERRSGAPRARPARSSGGSAASVASALTGLVGLKQGTRYLYAPVDIDTDGPIVATPIFSLNNAVPVTVPAYSVAVVVFPKR
ncbi:MAG: hypothetical protein ABI895_31415 [Deltaproteobacteria bacterium]